MLTSGKFIYRGIEKKGSGEFTNDKGQLIKFNDRIVVKLDETIEGQVFSREVKLDLTNPLVEKVKSLQPYSQVVCDFKVDFLGSGVKLELVGIDNKK